MTEIFKSFAYFVEDMVTDIFNPVSSQNDNSKSVNTNIGDDGVESISIEKQLFDGLSDNGIEVSDEQRRSIAERLDTILSYEPTVGVLGKTGVGKSSLCNALFGKDVFPISDIDSCTREPQSMILKTRQRGIKLLDVPGAGESNERDKEYANLYNNLMPKLDIVLWLIKADDKAFASDEAYYKKIVKPHIRQGMPFFFVLNQVDKIEPFRVWDINMHEPSEKQFANIHKKMESIASYFNEATSKVIPVSAYEKYGLVNLVNEIVHALPPEKKITFYRNINDENRTEETTKLVEESFAEMVGDFILDITGNVIAASVVQGITMVVEKVVGRIFDFILKPLGF